MMRTGKRIGWALGLAMLWAGAPLWADAGSDFKLGQQYQAAKQWGAAVKAYTQVLKDDPKATYAYKALGTVYYMAGDKRGALAYYRRYLATHPEDAATKRFADQLAAALGQPAAPATAAEAAPAPASGGRHGGFGVRVDLGAVMDSGSDVAQFYPSFVQPSASGGMALAYGASLDYALEGGFVVGLDLTDGPARNDKVKYTFGGASYTDSYSINNLCFGLSPGWRLHFGSAWLVEGRLGLGYMLSTLNESFAGGGGGSASATSSGLEVWPQVRGEYTFGRWGVGASVGYLYANLSPVKNSSGTPVQVNGSNWVESNGGVSFGLYGAYHFHPPF